jgi:hypothetical protein
MWIGSLGNNRVHCLRSLAPGCRPDGQRPDRRRLPRSGLVHWRPVGRRGRSSVEASSARNRRAVTADAACLVHPPAPLLHRLGVPRSVGAQEQRPRWSPDALARYRTVLGRAARASEGLVPICVVLCLLATQPLGGVAWWSLRENEGPFILTFGLPTTAVCFGVGYLLHGIPALIKGLVGSQAH